MLPDVATHAAVIVDTNLHQAGSVSMPAVRAYVVYCPGRT